MLKQVKTVMGIKKKAITKIVTCSRVLTGLGLDKVFKGKIKLQIILTTFPHSLTMSRAEARGLLFSSYTHRIKDVTPLHFIGDEEKEEAVSVNGRKNC